MGPSKLRPWLPASRMVGIALGIGQEMTFSTCLVLLVAGEASGLLQIRSDLRLAPIRMAVV